VPAANPWARALYEGLRARGKPHKLAVIALARRLLVTLDARLRTGADWKNPNAPNPA
jgi:transposase